MAAGRKGGWGAVVSTTMGRATRSQLLRASDRSRRGSASSPAARRSSAAWSSPRSGLGDGDTGCSYIATLLANLLALDSTAVVIGAMLIVPPMQLIAELRRWGWHWPGAVDPARRRLHRVSVGLVVLGAVPITKTLPFHEPTPRAAGAHRAEPDRSVRRRGLRVAAAMPFTCSASDVVRRPRSALASASRWCRRCAPRVTAPPPATTSWLAALALLFTANITGGILGVASSCPL